MLSDRTVLVTGATSGIGEAVCEDLLKHGANVIALGRNQDRLAQIQKKAPAKVHTIAFDLTDFDSYATIFDDVGKIDGLVYSAGVTDNNPLRFFSLERYNRVVAINQTAPIMLVSEFAKRSLLNPSASIVLLSSILGTRIGMKGTAAYAATKAALTAFAKVFSLELANKLIRINCVCPGMVNTALITNQQQVSDEALKLDMQKYPLGKRFAEASEIASTVRFLLSDDSSFITGSELLIDGGYSIQ